MKHFKIKINLITVLAIVIFTVTSSEWICSYFPEKYCVIKDTEGIVVGVASFIIAIIAISIKRNTA